MALLVSESSVAEDLTQEVFARLCAFLERQPEVNNAWGLLRGFMRNVWLEHLRRRRRSGVGEPDSERTPDPGLVGPADTAEKREDLDRLQRALAALTEEERAVILGKYYLDMTGEQLTEWLGVPRRTLLDRLHRAVGKLRKEFGVR